MLPSAHDSGRLKIGRLLAASGSPRAPEDRDQGPPATPYDWHDPHFFNADQRGRLAQAMGQVAGRMAAVFTRLCGRSCTVSLQTLTQHFAGDWDHPGELAQHCSLAFGPDKGPLCGFASIPPQTVQTWGTWLLGDSGSDRDPGRTLSALEESLLSDLLTAMLEVFLSPLRAQNPLEVAVGMHWGQLNLPLEPTEEVARVVFLVKGTDANPAGEVTILVPCRRLAALAGKTVTEPAKVTPQELSRILMEHLNNMPVVVAAVFASTTLTFQEMLELGPGDILLLDKSVDEPTELILDSRTVFTGRPVRSEGKHALAIVDAPGAADTPTAKGGVAQ